jgi:hypothetical protein
MNSPFADLTENRIETAKNFAKQFSQFEWEYLCSCQWFLTGMDQALATGDFFLLSIRAEQTLLNDKIRRPRRQAKVHVMQLPGSFQN